MSYTKLDNLSKDLISENVELIGQIFPSVITEQNGKKVIDFEKLKLEFTDEIADDEKERYQLTWPGKRQAIAEANKRTDKTLVPLVEKSVDFEHTKNIYIEGDNLEVLKVLQESYANSIKCIYIDPPYNTGKDFIYKDNFKSTTRKELEESGQIDEDGNKFVSNPESNGRYHSDWLSMMYPRLKLARKLLKDEGVIFISIDDNEHDNLRKICGEIFGESKVETYIWDLQDITEGSFMKTASKTTRNIHEYIVACFKSEKELGKYEEYRYLENNTFKNPDNDPNGNWMSGNISRNGITTTSGSKYFEIKTPTGVSYKRNWTVTESEFKELEARGKIYFADGGNGVPRLKIYQKDPSYSVLNSILRNLKSSSTGKKEVGRAIGTEAFDFPKPTLLIKRLLEVSKLEDGDIVLDFFSGSATTAHSVLQKNSETDLNLKYILVQLPEEIKDQKSAAYKYCEENNLEFKIPSIAQNRIIGAASLIQEETNADIDYGFRVFKLSESNLTKNHKLPAELEQIDIFASASKYVEGTSKSDILTHIILEMGLKLDVEIEKLNNDNFNVGNGLLFVSLADKFGLEEIETIVNINPDKLVLDENSFKDDAEISNTIESIKSKLPNILISVN